MIDNPVADPLNPDALQTLQKMAQKAAIPEKSEPGPGDVGPTTDTKGNSGLTPLEMTGDEVREWRKRVDRARARVKAREGKWDVLLKEYQPIVKKSGEAETVKVNAHFRNVHSKIGQLFYRSPDLILLPKDPSPLQNQQPNPMAAMTPPGMPQPPPLTMEDIVSVKQAVLKQKLGRDGIKANRLMDELLFDVLAWAGIGCCKVGYRCVMKSIPKPVMGPAPMQPGAMLGIAGAAAAPQMVPQIGPDGKPMMTMEEVPIFEEEYARRFSPKKLLVNDDLRSTRYDEDATFMGMDFYMAPKKAIAAFGLTDEEAGKAASDDRVYEYEEDKQGSGKTPGLVHGVELWVKASVYTDEPHPQAMNQLILIDGVDRAVVWRPSPDQEFGPDGKLTANSLLGFPIRVLTIRDLADSPFPESDSAFTNSQIKQLSTWTRQSIKMRDASIGKFLYDVGAIDEDDLDKIKNGESGDYIGIAAGKLGEKGVAGIIAQSAQLHGTNDDYRNREMIKQDMNETLGLSSVQSGTPQDTVHTATEIQAVGQAVAARNDKELGRVVDFYLDLARMVDQLVMRYADQGEYIQITGESGANRLMFWNAQMLSGRFLYDIAPDSQLRADTAQEFQLALNFYNIVAKDPLVNREYILRRLARMRGYDPSKVIISQAAMMLQPPQGGPGDVVNQHTASNSGGQPNAPGAANHRETQVK